MECVACNSAPCRTGYRRCWACWSDWHAAYEGRISEEEYQGRCANRSRVVHCKREPYDIYIGRPSKWGNPFSQKEDTLAEFKVATRNEAINAYAEWIKTQPELLAALPELRGKTLGCWCAPQRCHGSVLSVLANEDNFSKKV